MLILRVLDGCADFAYDHFGRVMVVVVILWLTSFVVIGGVEAYSAIVPSDPVITVDTPYGVATISGPAAEYVLQSAFPIVH